MSLVRSDLPARFGADMMTDGDEVKGQTTLEVCGAAFPSEKLRIARHQVHFPDVSVDGRRWVASETVAYEPGGAAQALQELRSAVLTCPSGFVQSRAKAMPEAQYDVQRLSWDVGWADETLAMKATVITRSGIGIAYRALYLRRGDTIVGLYVDESDHTLLRPLGASLRDRLRGDASAGAAV